MIPMIRGLEREYDAVQRRCLRATDQLAELTAQETTLVARAAALPAALATLSTRQVEAARARDQRETTLAVLESARLRHTAAVELAATSRAQDSARERLSVFIDTHQALKESWLELHEARLHGMAAEIAVDLAVGASCPVCGSCDHPHKASPGEGAHTREAEKAARRAADDAEIARQAQADIVRGLDTRLAVLSEQAGGLDAAAALAALDAARSQADQVTSAAAQWAEITANLERKSAEQAATTAEQAATTAEQEQIRLQLATLRSEADAHLDRLAEIGEQLTEHLGPEQTTHDLDASLRTELALVTELTGAHQAVAAALDTEAQAQADVTAAALAHGFDSVHDAVDAALYGSEADRLQALVAAYTEHLATAEATLSDPQVAAAAARPLPDLRALALQHDHLAERARLAHTAHDAAVRRHARITTLHRDTHRALESWRPVRDAHALAAGVSSFVEGKAVDNLAQVRLSAYVLAWRLSQVVAAANVRLGDMTSQRFALEHTSQRGAGETRGGLSLLVRDEWSGEARDPVTLSGGETFVVSLALALGLTDVVTQEAGGADIGTLFVDEGFGSLDADTLDDVMDTLDALRDGGRAVGIVSHVPELRDRIPTQLRVTKSRAGSGLRQTLEAS
jgi:exonuclease SbcC